MTTLINNGTVIIKRGNQFISFTPECLIIIEEYNGETAILMDTDGICYNLKGNHSSRAYGDLVIDGEYLREEPLPELTEDFINNYDFSFIF